MGDDRAAGCRGEPFHLLQFYPIPGRVADYGVEAALAGLPVAEDTGEVQFPVDDAAFCGQGGDFAPEGYESGKPGEVELGRGPVCFGDGVRPKLQEVQPQLVVLGQPPGDGGGAVIANLATEQGGLTQGEGAVALAGGEPAQGGKEVQQIAQGLLFAEHSVEPGLRLAHFVHIRVVNLLDPLDRVGVGGHPAGDKAGEPAAGFCRGFQVGRRLVEPAAHQGVAATQVVLQIG